jgi:putative tricarboxylic transport membrane protein
MTEQPHRIDGRDLGALVIPAVVLVVGVALVIGNVTMEVRGDGEGIVGPQGFGWLVAGLCFAIAVLMTLQILRPPAPVSADPGDEADEILDHEPDAPARSNWRSIGIVVGGVVLFIVALEPVGWLISATLMFAIVAFGLGARNHVASLLGGLGMAAAIQLVFSGLLGIHVPAGILGA